MKDYNKTFSFGSFFLPPHINSNPLYGTKYSRIDQAKFVEYSLSRPYPFKFFKGCLLQILLGPSLINLSHIKIELSRKRDISHCTKNEVFH